MKQYLPLLLLFFITLSVRAQYELPDSIKAKYADRPKDTEYVDELNDKAISYLKINPTATRKVSEHVMKIASDMKYTKGYARAVMLMGNSYWYEGMYEFAQNYYLLAARQYQSINDSIGLGQTYNNIGEVYKKLNNRNLALDYLLKALDLKRRDTATWAITYYNIAELYIHLKNIEKSKAYLDSSFSMATKLNDEKVIAYCYMSRAAIKEIEGDYSSSLDYYLKAEMLWKKRGETRLLIQCYQDVAQVYWKIKNFDVAELYLSKAIQLAQRIKVPDLQIKNYERYSRLDSLRGNYQRALYYNHKYNVLKDSVFSLLKEEQIARLQTIYETENRERENQKLKSEQQLKNSQLAYQRITLIGISIVLIFAGVVAWILYRQRKKIVFQKEAIEVQATALLKLNEELQELNKNLEQRIEQRTSQLTLQNQRLAEFTFINAHKLRSPVASILGLINLLYTDEKIEDRETILAHLRTCSEELDQTIREVSTNLENAIVKETRH